MFRLTEDPISRSFEHHHSCGALVSFEGRVRDSHQGKSVLQLEYECEPILCQSLGSQLISEALLKFGVQHIHVTHRMGTLNLGELALLVEVESAHRREALEACDWVINEAKRRLPIWKKEHYASGDSGWVGADTASSAAPVTDKLYFDRQICLPEIGADGQELLRSATVLVVGAGGLGNPVLSYLAAAGIGKIVIFDGDRVEASNLHRQLLFGADDVGKLKAEVAANAIRKMTPLVDVEPVSARFTSQFDYYLTRVDLVIDCTDNFQSKFLINDLCVAHEKPLIQASIYSFEGQLAIFGPKQGSPCLRCLWPTTPPSDCVGSCAEVGVMGFVPGIFGCLQAAEAVKYLVGMSSPLATKLLTIDLISLESNLMSRTKAPGCPTCGSGTKTDEIIEIEFDEIQNSDLEGWVVLDVREVDEEFSSSTIHQLRDCWTRVPMTKIDEWVGNLVPTASYLVVCRSGIRSLKVARRLRDLGLVAVSLRGGMSQFPV